MLLKRNTFLLLVVLCSLVLWSQSVSAGSSFLSPSQKPQHKGKSYRVGRRAMEQPSQPPEDSHVTISAPFEIGITMGEEDFQEYGMVLQEMIKHLLESLDSTERR